MKKQSKTFWISYIVFTVVLTFSLYKITMKQINYPEIEMQELNIRRLVSIVESDSKNDNIEIVNPPEEEPVIENTIEENNNAYIQDDYWYYINFPLDCLFPY